MLGHFAETTTLKELMRERCSRREIGEGDKGRSGKKIVFFHINKAMS